MKYNPLSDYAEIKGGKRLPKGLNLSELPTEHPYIRVRDLGSEKTLELNSSYEYVDNETQKAKPTPDRQRIIILVPPIR